MPVSRFGSATMPEAARLMRKTSTNEITPDWFTASPTPLGLGGGLCPPRAGRLAGRYSGVTVGRLILSAATAVVATKSRA